MGMVQHEIEVSLFEKVVKIFLGGFMGVLLVSMLSWANGAMLVGFVSLVLTGEYPHDYPDPFSFSAVFVWLIWVAGFVLGPAVIFLERRR